MQMDATNSMSANATHAEREVTIVNKQGLHARPVMRFIDIASQYQSTVRVFKGKTSVDGKSPIRSISDLTQALNRKPGNGAYGTTSNTGIVSAELYKQRTGLKTNQVVYKGNELFNDLHGGHLDFISMAPTSLAEPIRTGKMQGLAVTSSTRLGLLPDLPTMAEAGFPDYDLTPWIGLVVPSGTPRQIVDKLAAWHRQINSTAETKEKLILFGMDPLEGDAGEMAARIKSDTEKWAEFVKLARIEPQ